MPDRGGAHHWRVQSARALRHSRCWSGLGRAETVEKMPCLLAPTNRAFNSRLNTELRASHSPPSAPAPMATRLENATRIAVDTILTHLSTNTTPYRVTFVCFDTPTTAVYQRILTELLG